MKTNLLALIALLGLLALTVALAFVPLGGANLWLSLLIAAAKASLIVAVFMEWAQGDTPMRLALLVGLIWLAVLMVLVGTDIGVRPPGILLLR